MKLKNKIIYINLILINLILGTLNLYAQDDFFYISDKIDFSKELLNSGVNKMLLDSRGYLWIGTNGGLFCNNGITTSCYKNEVHNKIIPSNVIRSLNEDKHGRIWIGTDQGLAIYDYKKDKFFILNNSQVISPFNRFFIDKIIFWEDYALCLSRKSGIVIYDMDLNFIKQDKNNSNTIVKDAILIGKNNLFLAEKSKFYLYNIPSGSYEEVSTPFLNSINKIRKISYDKVLVACDNGVHIISCEMISDNQIDLEYVKQIIEAPSYEIFVDKQKGVWVTHNYSGFTYFPDVMNNPEISYRELKDNNVSGFLSLSNDNMAVSTIDDGIYFISLRSNAFKTIENSLLKNAELMHLNRSRVLVTTLDNHKFVYNSSSNTLRKLEQDENSLEISKLLKYSNKCLWSFTRKGLYKTNILDGAVKSTLINDSKLSVLSKLDPRSFAEDRDGNIWVGYNSNLFKITLDDDFNVVNVESIKDNDFVDNSNLSKVKIIYPDTVKNCVWVGTNSQGLYKIELQESATPLKDLKIRNYKYKEGDIRSLSNNNITSIIRTSDSSLWIGTVHGGVCRVYENDNNLYFGTITEDDGLPSNLIHGLAGDKNGNLWIATNHGLAEYLVENNYIRVFDKNDGLPFANITQIVVQRDNENIVLSSDNILCSFNPNDISINIELPKLQFKDLHIYNSKIETDKEYGGRFILTERLKDRDKIKLKYNENVFSIGLDVISMDKSDNPYVHYILKPSNNEWTKTAASSLGRISFNNLSAGEYTLEVYLSSSVGAKTDVKRIYIDIAPSFWESTYAYILYILLILFVSYISLRTWLRFQKLNFKLQLEESQKENLEKLDKEKQQYFANITHEIKTPLTLILAPLAELTDKFKLDVKVRDRLSIIRRQANRMQQLIELSNGIQKNDANLLKVKPKIFIFNDFINSSTADFKFMGNYYGKNFVIDAPTKAIRVTADIDLLENLVNNLINNAFKHTQSNDTITVSYRCNKQILTLTITDTGNGISCGDIPFIFDRFYKANNGAGSLVGGTGIGLAFTKRIAELHQGTISVDSVVGEFTKFTVNLPIIVDEVDVKDIEIPSQEIERAEMIIGNIEEFDKSEFDIKNSNSMVYIVDDNYEMRAFLTDIIGKHYKTKSFEDGADCLEECEKEWPDIIVSDVMMEKMRGDELCRVIKSDLKTSHIPIILITACNTIDDKIKALEDGADAYIQKPFYPKHVITRIESLLKNRETIKERFQSGIPLVYGKEKGVSSRDNKFLEDIYKIFDENLSNEDIDLNEVALSLGLNRTTFFSKIKALLGSTPYELLKEYRLQKAADMLLSKEYNVKEACMLTGFKSRPHFSRLFKDKYGVSPSQYGENTE